MVRIHLTITHKYGKRFGVKGLKQRSYFPLTGFYCGFDRLQPKSPNPPDVLIYSITPLDEEEWESLNPKNKLDYEDDEGIGAFIKYIPLLEIQELKLIQHTGKDYYSR